ncbi:MAG: VPLPA-CTERM sorting domain-containing protein [Pseudomonadota bacterium]
MRGCVLTGILIASVATALALPVSAATLPVRFDVSTPTDVAGPDTRFVALCGGSDNFGCEFAVAEARAGSRGTGGNTEAAIFNRIDNTAVSGQLGAGIDLAQEQPFTLSYTAATTTLTWSIYGNMLSDVIDLSAIVTGDNPTEPARTLVIRTRQAEVNDLMLGGMALPALSTLASNTRGYLYIGGMDFTADFTLTGDVLLGAGSNAAAAVQFKITDLEPPSTVPLPAGAWLMLTAMAGFAVLRRGRAHPA